MIFESVESFVGQLVMHKYICKDPSFMMQFSQNLLCKDSNFRMKCDECKILWEIDPAHFMGTSFGIDIKTFHRFISEIDCSIYSGSYEELFKVYSVMVM